MIKNKIFFLIAFLIGISLFSLFKYVTIFYEKRAILSDWVQMKSQVLLLNTLKEHLNNQLQKKTRIINEKEKARQELLRELNMKNEKIVQIEELLNKAQHEIEQLKSQNNSLAEENRLLLEKIDKINQEYNFLLSRWNSMEELRKAIAQLKRDIYLKRRQQMRAKDRSIEGNRGYIIKDGKPTLPLKVKIEVIPIQ
jgi:predicted RNase H-like nuclease (RuvC/YqgF family)